jgi:hypothetical protein
MWIAAAILLVVAPVAAWLGLPMLRTWLAVTRSTSGRTEIVATQVTDSAEGTMEIDCASSRRAER